MVRQCEQCQSIDPAPKRHQEGKLSVDEDWTRAAIDITHYRSKPFLSLIDCGPGRFAIWRETKGESAAEVCKELDNIFYERGPVKQALLDNAPTFKSVEMKILLKKWGIKPYYRAAWRANCNGIVERHHRTIKAMAERMQDNPIEAVYWYNVAPKDTQKEETVPQKSVCSYNWRIKGYNNDKEEEEPQCEVKVGDEVWVKPGNARCTTKWREGIVTGVNSDNNVDIDGMARHILDIRRRNNGEEDETEEEQNGSNSDEDIEQENIQPDGRRYPIRDRAPPAWMGDYVHK